MSATRAAPHKGKGRASGPNRRKPATKRRSPALPIALGLLALLAIVAVLMTRGSSDSESETPDGGSAAIEQTRDVEITGAALADYEAGSDTAIGSTVPVVKGATFDGASITIGEPGTPELVFFLAHWCPHCRKEVPVITEWLAEAGLPEGIALKGVSTGLNEAAPNYPPSKWLDTEGWPIKTLADDKASSAGQAYGLTGYPYFVAIDASGRVAARASGELTVAQIEALIGAAKTGAG